MHIMLGPTLAAGCCGLTRKVSRAVMLKPFLFDTFLKNVNKVGRQGWSELLAYSKSLFEDLPLCCTSFLFFLTMFQYIPKSWILLSFPISDSRESTSPLQKDRKFVIDVSHHQHLLSFLGCWKQSKLCTLTW